MQTARDYAEAILHCLELGQWKQAHALLDQAVLSLSSTEGRAAKYRVSVDEICETRIAGILSKAGFENVLGFLQHAKDDLRGNIEGLGADRLEAALAGLRVQYGTLLIDVLAGEAEVQRRLAAYGVLSVQDVQALNRQQLTQILPSAEARATLRSLIREYRTEQEAVAS